MNKKILILLFVAFTAFTVQGQQDFSYDKQIGAEAAMQVEQLMGSYPDSALTTYIVEIGDRLAVGLGNIPFEFRFRVVDMPEPNAFALPGGYIYVSRGLLSLVNEEDELAGVMGHEMIHVTKRHSIKQMKQGIIPALLKIPGALIGLVSPDLGRIINTPIELGGELFLTSYSRKQEREADEFGIKLASQAGYDPSQLSGILQHLADDMELQTGEEERKSYFSTHPYTPKRVDDINEKAPQLSWSEEPQILSREGIYKLLDGMTLGPNPAQGVIENNIFRHPDLKFGMNLPKGWEVMNAPVALVATQSDGEAQLFLGGDDPKNRPDSLGPMLAEVLIKEYEITPYQNEKISVNGYEGYVVAFKDNSGKQPVDIQLYWIHTGDLLLNVMGMGYIRHSKELSKSAYSIRPLSDEEASGVTVTRLRVEAAKADEDLQAFAARTACAWDVEKLALMNDLPPDVKLIEGQLLKIAKVEAYLQ